MVLFTEVVASIQARIEACTEIMGDRAHPEPGTSHVSVAFVSSIAKSSGHEAVLELFSPKF